jgi:hypothetical protein
MSRHILSVVAVRRWVALGTVVFLGIALVHPAIGQLLAPALRAPPPAPAAPPSLSLSAPPPPAPSLVTTVHRRRTGLVATGAVIFGLSWGLAVFLSAALINARAVNSGTALEYSAPVVGPLAAGPEHDKGLMAFWSATELLGVVLFGFGMKGEDVPVTARW